MKIEIVVVNMVCYGRMKAAGRRPLLPVKFRHGGVRTSRNSYVVLRVADFCGKTWHGNKKLTAAAAAPDTPASNFAPTIRVCVKS